MSLEIPQLIARNQAIRRQKELFASGGVPDCLLYTSAGDAGDPLSVPVMQLYAGPL